MPKPIEAMIALLALRKKKPVLRGGVKATPFFILNYFEVEFYLNAYRHVEWRRVRVECAL